MLNRVVLMGRLTVDPEHKQTPNGTSVTDFQIAVDRNIPDKATGTRQTDFIRIVAWGYTADFVCKYFSKGSMIAIDGRIQTRNYQDQNGNKRTAFEVVAEQVHFAGSKNETAQKPSTNFPTPENFPEPPKGTGFSIGDFEEIDTDDSDLPF